MTDSITQSAPVPEENERITALRLELDRNRAKFISVIFGLYDKLPETLENFKEQGLAEDEVVGQLGLIVDDILKEFETLSFAIFIKLMRETKLEDARKKQGGLIIPSSTGEQLGSIII